MLAESGPESPLDTRRLSDFSPRRENSHGASCVGRIQPHPCSQPPTAHRRLQTSGRARRPLRNPTTATSCGRTRPLFAICPPACAVRLIGERWWPAFPRHRSSPLSRSGAVEGTTFGSCSGEHVFFASRGRTRKPSRPPPSPSESAASSARPLKWRKTKLSPSNARSRAGGQPERAALIRALTAPMSVRPAAFALTAAMTLPMSLTDAAPVAAMASWMIVSTSVAESCAGR